MKPLLKLIVLLLTQLTIVSCTVRDEVLCRNNKKVRIPQTVKDYFYFKHGTYWVYQNQTTLEVDSHWVCDSYLGTASVTYDKVGCNCYNHMCFENMFVNILSPKYNGCNDGSNTHEYLRYIITVQDEYKQYLGVDFYFTLTNQGYGNVFLMDGTWFGDGYKDTANCIINGVNYIECNVQRRTLGNIYGRYKEVIMNKNVGIISYVNSNDSTRWNLIKSNILK